MRCPTPGTAPDPIPASATEAHAGQQASRSAAAGDQSSAIVELTPGQHRDDAARLTDGGLPPRDDPQLSRDRLTRGPVRSPDGERRGEDHEAGEARGRPGSALAACSTFRRRSRSAWPRGAPSARRCRWRLTVSGRRPTDRPDPVGILEEQDATRVPELVPIRHGRMIVSPFTFYRGGAAIMAWDLSRTPTTGLRVQCCGDAHLSNFGVFAAPDRRMVFDLNDFDETLPAPFEWDVKRLVASFVVAARDNGHRPKKQRAAARAAAAAYRTTMAKAATMRFLDVWYTRIDVERAARRAHRRPRTRRRSRPRRRTSPRRARGRAWARWRSSPSGSTAATGSSSSRRSSCARPRRCAASSSRSSARG